MYYILLMFKILYQIIHLCTNSCFFKYSYSIKNWKTSLNKVCVCAMLLVRVFATCGPQSARLLCPRGFPGKNTRVVCRAQLQGIFLTQGLNPCLQHSLIGGFFTISTTWEAQINYSFI